MSTRTYYSGCHRLLVAALLVNIVVCVGLTGKSRTRERQSTQEAGLGFDPFKYLPPGAKIKDRHKDVVFADLGGYGQKDVVIFYTVGTDPNDHKANILVLKPSDRDYVRLWESTFNGSWGFGDPTGVYDLNKSGKPQIIAYREIGASCPGFLEIYECRDDRIERLTGKWGYEGHCEAVEIQDLDHDGIPEILVLGSHGVSKSTKRY